MYTSITKSRLDQLVEEGWLISQVHPTLDLTIYNYSQKTQFESCWTPETLMCRGLVVNSDGEIVARPFPKFFNASEHAEGEIPELPFEVYEKMDGSLGIFFLYNGSAVFASRGSFTSEQAVKGWEMMKKLNWHSLAYGHTHMFEIIYPENRIVVDYGDAEKLVLLGVIETATGREIPRKNIEEHLGEYFELVKAYNVTDSWAHLRSQNEPNREGYVIRFSNGFRVKVKFDEYVRLHRIITNVSTVNVWEHLMSGNPMGEFLEKVPDEFFDWVREVEADLRSQFNFIKATAEAEYALVVKRVGEVPAESYGRVFAERIVNHPMKHLLFSLKNGRNIDEAIWKMIRPEWSKPFFKQAAENC
jgi:RNA ligase